MRSNLGWAVSFVLAWVTGCWVGDTWAMGRLHWPGLGTMFLMPLAALTAGLLFKPALVVLWPVLALAYWLPRYADSVWVRGAVLVGVVAAGVLATSLLAQVRLH